MISEIQQNLQFMPPAKWYLNLHHSPQQCNGCNAALQE